MQLDLRYPLLRVLGGLFFFVHILLENQDPEKYGKFEIDDRIPGSET